MTLPSFLRGRPPAPPAGLWRLDFRHDEGGPWTPLGPPSGEATARDEALAPHRPLPVGSLVRLVAPGGGVRGFWVALAGGLADAGPVPGMLAAGDDGKDPTVPAGGAGWDWEAAWEGAGANPAAMVRAGARADRRRLALAAAAAAETVLPLFSDRETRPREALDLVRAWARGRADYADVDRAGRAALDAALEARVHSSMRHAGQAVWFATGVPFVGADPRPPALARFFARDSNTVETCAAEAVIQAAYAAAWANPATAPTWYASRLSFEWAMAPLVRAHLPLSVALRARAGDPTPLDPSELARV